MRGSNFLPPLIMSRNFSHSLEMWQPFTYTPVTVSFNFGFKQDIFEGMLNNNHTSLDSKKCR